MIKASLFIKFQRFLTIILFGLILFVGCGKGEIKEDPEIKAIIATAKYCHTDYYNIFHPNLHRQDSMGVNIYFAGKIFNKTADTLYIPNRELKFRSKYDSPLQESFFYSIINGDTLFFNFYSMWIPKVAPNGSLNLNLQYYITSDEPKLLLLFKNIDKDQTILDTMKICFATPDMQLDNGKKLLPPIVLERSKKFRVDTAVYNSYFERIFKGSEYYENPPKEYLEMEKLYE